MSDDRIQQGLDAYADQLKRAAAPVTAAEIRRRAARRRRNRAAGAAFAAVLLVGAGLGVALNRGPDRSPVPAGPSPSASPLPSRSATTVRSDVTKLREIGIDLETGVLIDVADDGVDRWMQIGVNDVVDFTGAAKDPSTEMSLIPAPVAGRNLVEITPLSRPGFCVVDTPQPPLALQPCRDDDEAQTWTVVPAGDSGQFQLEGPYGIVTVDDRLVPEGRSGRTGLQTIRFDR